MSTLHLMFYPIKPSQINSVTPAVAGKLNINAVKNSIACVFSGNLLYH